MSDETVDVRVADLEALREVIGDLDSPLRAAERIGARLIAAIPERDPDADAVEYLYTLRCRLEREDISIPDNPEIIVGGLREIGWCGNSEHAPTGDRPGRTLPSTAEVVGRLLDSDWLLGLSVPNEGRWVSGHVSQPDRYRIVARVLDIVQSETGDDE